jgi:hypothetical protein
MARFPEAEARLLNRKDMHALQARNPVRAVSCRKMRVCKPASKEQGSESLIFQAE